MFFKYKKKIEPLIAIIAQPFLSWNPDVLTLISVLFAGGFLIGMTLHNFLFAGLSWIGIIFDALDGFVARKAGKVTKFGAFFDSTTDRLSDFCYISAFGFAGLIDFRLVVFGLITTLLISYTKARGESLLPKDVQINKGIMQRTERLIVLFVIFLLFVENLSTIGVILFVLMIGLNFLTVLQRVVVARKLLG